MMSNSSGTERLSTKLLRQCAARGRLSSPRTKEKRAEVLLIYYEAKGRAKCLTHDPTVWCPDPYLPVSTVVEMV